MVGGLVFENARRLARELVKRFGVEAPMHVNVEGFAARLGFKISMAMLDGAIAQLVIRTGRQPLILLSDRLTDPAMRRFTVAHELGHYVLRHPSPSIAEMYDPTQQHGLAPLLSSVNEAEANAFARELLMPEPLVRLACDLTSASLDPALRIAYTFGVSVPTSAIRFVELTDIPCIVVLSEAGLVRWSAPHAAFPGRVAFRRQVDQRSLAWDYFQRGTLCSEVEHVPAAAWLDESAEGPLLEHSIASHERGTVLTLLSLPAHHRVHLAA
jgi:Zn-dependent peptidase ImmA (M78 family)